MIHPHEVDLDVKVGVISVSTSRWRRYGSLKGVENIPDDDESARIVVESLNCVDYRLVPDGKLSIIRAIAELAENVDVIVTIGGTGISPTDITVDVIRGLLDREIEGFGDIFRMLSYGEVGADAMLSRALAGILDGRVIFCLPGSKRAVRLGVELISRVIRHVVSHVKGLR